MPLLASSLSLQDLLSTALVSQYCMYLNQYLHHLYIVYIFIYYIINTLYIYSHIYSLLHAGFKHISPHISRNGWFCLDNLRKNYPPLKSMKYPPSSVKISKNLLLQDLPSTITQIVLNRTFNEPISTNSLPPSLTHLSFGDSFDRPVDHLLPLTLTYLFFGCLFNQSVDDLPSSLHTLILGTKFNKLVDHLPRNLRVLAFNPFLPLDLLFQHERLYEWDSPTEYTFSHPCAFCPSYGVLLRRSEHYRSIFNHPMRNLPPQLTHLVTGDKFESELFLPASLTHLFVYESGCAELILPPNLTHLFLWDCPNIPQPISLPSSLVSLVSHNNSAVFKMTSLPNLRNLFLLENWGPDETRDSFFALSAPLTHLSLSSGYPIAVVPPTITHLVCNASDYPPNLKSLFTFALPESFATKLPPGTTHVSFS